MRLLPQYPSTPCHDAYEAGLNGVLGLRHMIAHTGLFVRDYKKGKAFYEKALKPLGYRVKRDFAEYKACGFMQGGQTDFWIGVPAAFAPIHVAFMARNKAAVAAFYKAALAAGGKDNGAPGFRTHYGPTYYAAFILDPWGNNIEACYFGERAPAAKKAAPAKKQPVKAKKAAPRTSSKKRR